MAITKAKPQRSCIGCGVKKDKNDFVRVVRTPEGSYILDESMRANGRGAYICKSADCFNAAVHNHGFEKSFKAPIPKEVIDELCEEMMKIGQG